MGDLNLFDFPGTIFILIHFYLVNATNKDFSLSIIYAKTKNNKNQSLEEASSGELGVLDTFFLKWRIEGVKPFIEGNIFIYTKWEIIVRPRVKFFESVPNWHFPQLAIPPTGTFCIFLGH